MDDLTARTAAVLAVVLVSTALGLALRRRAGRTRRVAGAGRLAPADLGAPLGRRGTFVQFSSPACSACRSVHRVLSELEDPTGGVVHIEIDATQRLDLARRLSILRTPTVLVLDGDGTVASRTSGPITPAQARGALAQETPNR